jgi:tetrapyrrole methylase family protein/MazG family protein
MGQVTFMADIVDKDWMHELESIMSRLRAKDGCPWDREQDHVTLQRYLIEEAYELIDAIDDGDDEHLVDELGDVLLQVVFHCQIARETKRFDLQDVARTISEKLLRRHPHVFGDTTVDDADGVVRQWEEIKREESTGRKRTSHLDGVPRHLPALLQAEKIQKKAAKVGFDWPNIDGVIEKLDEELAELKAARAAGDAEAVAAEAGDLLFTIVNFSRFCKFNAEDALRGTVGRFRERFSFIEQELQRQGRTFEASSLAELDALWDEAKRRIEDGA